MAEGRLDALGFQAAPDLREWVLATFLDEDSSLHNPDHVHLKVASIGFLWSSVLNVRAGKQVLGQAEFRPPSGTMGKWARARAEQQLHAWFGRSPDFLITLDARYAAAASDAAFCALVEHELSHCGQENDEFGGPRFRKSSGLPVFCLRAHDVETFVGVAARYGPIDPGVQELLNALSKPKLFSDKDIAISCGTCSR
jgi:hypothetical protein